MRINLYTGKRIIFTVAALLCVLLVAPHFSSEVHARSAREIDVSVDVALDRFKMKSPEQMSF